MQLANLSGATQDIVIGGLLLGSDSRRQTRFGPHRHAAPVNDSGQREEEVSATGNPDEVPVKATAKHLRRR